MNAPRRGRARALTAAVLLLTAVAQTGCAGPQPLYHWGDYEAQVYAYLKGQTNPAEQVAALEKMREEARATGRSLPPGFHAHLALLYETLGQGGRAAGALQAETARFPEFKRFGQVLAAGASGAAKPARQAGEGPAAKASAAAAGSPATPASGAMGQ